MTFSRSRLYGQPAEKLSQFRMIRIRSGPERAPSVRFVAQFDFCPQRVTSKVRPYGIRLARGNPDQHAVGEGQQPQHTEDSTLRVGDSGRQEPGLGQQIQVVGELTLKEGLRVRPTHGQDAGIGELRRTHRVASSNCATSSSWAKISVTLAESRTSPLPPSDQAPPETSGPPPSSMPRPSAPREIGGRQGPEPTRYGDWEKDGR